MEARFEIVNEEYIEELNKKSENEKKNSTEWWKKGFEKNWRMKETCKQIYKSTRTMSSTNDCRSLS